MCKLKTVRYSYNDGDFEGKMLNYRIKRGEEIYGLFCKDLWGEKKYTKLMKLTRVGICTHPHDELYFCAEGVGDCYHFTEFVGADAEYANVYNGNDIDDEED